MGFTEAEATAQVGKWVRLRDAAGWNARMAQGSIGEVVRAQRQQREEGGTHEEGWGVCIEFSLSRDQCVSLLLRDIGKEQYEGALEEIAVELSLHATCRAECAKQGIEHSGAKT
jgi:hypothetical protein